MSCEITNFDWTIMSDNSIICFFLNLPKHLFEFEFHYACMVLAVLIISISFWTILKQREKLADYHLFVLNQVFFDFIFLIYAKFCIRFDYVQNQFSDRNCFDVDIGDPFGVGINGEPFLLYFNTFFLKNLPFFDICSILLFSFTRFLALFFPIFYQLHFTTKKILRIILCFDFICILLYVAHITSFSIFRYDLSVSNYVLYTQITSISYTTILTFLTWLSFTFTILFTQKLVRYFLRPQTQQDRDKLFHNLRLSCTLLIQSFLLMIHSIFNVLGLFYDYREYRIYLISTAIYREELSGDSATEALDDISNAWYYTSDLVTLGSFFTPKNNLSFQHYYVQIRVFIDYLCILLIISGYREVIWSVVYYFLERLKIVSLL